MEGPSLQAALPLNTPVHPPRPAAELRIVHCNDLFGMGSPLGAVASLQRLRTLAVEDYHCRLYREPVAELGRLTSVGGVFMCWAGRGISKHLGGGGLPLPDLKRASSGADLAKCLRGA